MKTCDKCKYWRKFDFSNKHHCNFLSVKEADEMDEDQLSLECIHDSLIYTGALFGCIHWEEKGEINGDKQKR